VPIKNSVKPDYIVSLEDGKKFKSLKRHLTPDEYRAKWGLRYDYPMVAAAYAAKRSELAKSKGLGNARAQAKAAKVPVKKGPVAKGPQSESLDYGRHGLPIGRPPNRCSPSRPPSLQLK
jgi:hypothetical protein